MRVRKWISLLIPIILVKKEHESIKLREKGLKLKHE